MNPLATKGTIDAISGLTQEIGDTVDKISTSAEEKLQLKNELSETALYYITKTMELQHTFMMAESKGNWLQRSWRPVLALAFGFLIMWQYWLGPVIKTFIHGLEIVPLPDNLWTLLTGMIGIYAGGRTIEKVAETVTKNVDLPFIRKRRRILDQQQDKKEG